MKKAFVFGLLAILAITGCQAELEEVNPENNKKPEVVTQEPSKVFTAIVEDDFSGDTKTILNDSGNVLWKQGDQVSIFAASTVNEQYQVSDASDGKTSATLNKIPSSSFVAGTDIDNNVAFYPYASTAELSKSGSSYIISGIELPATQTYVAGSFGNGAFPMATVTSSTEDMNLKFKNVLGGLKLQLKGTATITSITVTGNNNEILCGDAEVTMAYGGVPSISLSDASAKTVTLDCGAGVTLDSETATPFIIALPPMTMTGGFKVTVTDSEGKQMEIKTTKSQTITRSNLLKMPAVTYEGEGIQGVTPLTFTSTGSTSISLKEKGNPAPITLEYKVDNGEWINYSVGDAIALTDGQVVSFRAGEGGNSFFSPNGDYYYTYIVTGSGTVAVSGDIMSLLNKEGGLTIPRAYCFYRLFSGCSQLTTAPELPATTLAEHCYERMFWDCTGLTTAPELPATTLAEYCYDNMFIGCTGLTTAPELPATTLADYCYNYMFSGCTSLTTAPELPATNLADYCYKDMFWECTGLATAPELPAKTLTRGCYQGMFRGCTGLATAPELPAKTLTRGCYYEMFWECTSLTTAPELPATTLADLCYLNMFWRCTGLTSAPELPATTLAERCYDQMFKGCTGLTSAPELPATTLESSCYYGMFWDCTSLTTAPELPATTLVENCYYRMFSGCTSLTTAPELPATTLVSQCYHHMFQGCTKLNYIKALFTTRPSSSYTLEWVSGVASTGTFVKSSSATWNVTGDNGIPEGWTVIKDDPLKFTSTGSTSISLTKTGSPSDITLEYKVDDGEWLSYTVGDAIDLTDGQEVSFRAGEGGNSSFNSRSHYYRFIVNGSGTVAASGNIMFLLNNKKGGLTIPAGCFCHLFNNCSKLTSAPELPATTLNSYCYYHMFDGCTGLTSPPELPAKVLGIVGLDSYCYSGMFYGCSGLTSAPELPATTLTNSCYYSMFYGCTSLTTAPVLPATTLAYGCYADMFDFCTGLTSAPELPATTLATSCYSGMFYGCSGLTSAPELPATTLTNSCYSHMFDGCTGLTSAPKLPATTLATNCYYSMFYGCSGLTSAPELPATTLADSCYCCMFWGCTGLTTAPELPATTLANGCYANMFQNCTKLDYIKALFTTTPSSSYTENWVSGVAATGTFVKSKDATWDVIGDNGIPEGWTVYTTGAPAGVEAVDLGLPSGLKWASCNVGATKPFEYGDFFAWGETEQKTDYSWSNYKWCNGEYNKLTKYCTYSSFWDSSAPMDNKTFLDAEDDAARANWGGSWRMPLDAEWTELRENCTWTWTTQNGVNGRLVTGPNGKSIFLPAADNQDGTYLGSVGSFGSYWSSSINTDYPEGALGVSFYSGDVYGGSGYRCYGQSVRPVCP